MSQYLQTTKISDYNLEPCKTTRLTLRIVTDLIKWNEERPLFTKLFATTVLLK